MMVTDKQILDFVNTATRCGLCGKGVPYRMGEIEVIPELNGQAKAAVYHPGCFAAVRRAVEQAQPRGASASDARP